MTKPIPADATIVEKFSYKDEFVSYNQSKKTVKKYGGKIISTKQSDQRLIEFKFNNKKYMFDNSNKIFTHDKKEVKYFYQNPKQGIGEFFSF